MYQYATAISGWNPSHTDWRPPNSYPDQRLSDPRPARYPYQDTFGVLSATSYMDSSFFTAEKCSALSAAAPPQMLSPSPPSISASSHSSKSPRSSTSLGSGAKDPMGLDSGSRSYSESPPEEQKPTSSPSSPGSPDPEAPLNYAKERRRAQNRRAQQTHRERRAQRVKDLEVRVQELESLENILRAENGELKEELMRLEGMLRTAQLCRDAGETIGFPDPVAMWNSIQKHPVVAAGGVDVAVVCEELRSLASRRGSKALLLDPRRINEVIEKCRSDGVAD